MKEGGQTFRFSESRNRGRSNVLFLRARVCEDNRARQNFQTAKKRQIIKKLSIPGKPSEQKPMLQRLRQLFAPIFNNSVKMDFSEVKQGLEAGSILLIDVRNPDEVRNLGKIPGSHNIPCK